MSVITEIRKTKQRWSLNPRGKAWSEDSNKFGQKMLEKMGWSRGKGLGSKEDGVIEHFRVSYKNDTKGMGFKETDGQWTEHDSNFNALLQSLSGHKEKANDIKISSLETKSQSSKVRVHYKKFTRGKDLSRCSEKDLANIFGKKSLKSTPRKQEDNEEDKELPSDNFTHNAGSMVDYFKKKLPTFGKIGSPRINRNGFSNRNSESEGENYIGFGFNTPEKKRKSSGEVVEATPKKVKCEDEDKIGLSNPAFDPLFNNIEVQKHVLNTIKEEESDENEMNPEISKNSIEDSFNEQNDTSQNLKRKKKKQSQESSLENLQNTESKCIKKKKRRKDSDSSSEEVEKKKKKKEGCINLVQEDVYDGSEENSSSAVDNPNFEDGDCQESYINENFEVKRKKKKNKDAVSMISQNFDDGCQNSFLKENFEVKRKKKNKEDNSMALVNPVFNSESIHNSYVDENFEVKRKKKNKQDNHIAIDNPNFEDKGSEENSFNNNFEVKRKKKKKKNKNNNTLAIDNPTFNDSLDTSNYHSENSGIINGNGDSVANDISISSTNKIKKKRKKESEDSSIDSSIQNLSIIDSEMRKTTDEQSESNFDLILNITSTPRVPETKSSLNNSKQSSVKRRKSVRFSDVNEERIIPNNEDIENMEIKNELFDINTKVISDGLREVNGTSNLGFNRAQVILDENIDEISKKIDGLQAEIENDMNEAKARYIGEVNNPDGENEKLPNGTKLKFKYAQFGKTPNWVKKSPVSRAKSSYKHLIKGDIILGFNNTNLHEIKGYAVDMNNS